MLQLRIARRIGGQATCVVVVVVRVISEKLNISEARGRMMWRFGGGGVCFSTKGKRDDGQKGQAEKNRVLDKVGSKEKTRVLYSLLQELWCSF